VTGILITGGANGIGAAIARRAVNAYDQVYILDKDVVAGAALAAELVAYGHSAMFLDADVSNSNQLDAAFSQITTLSAAVNCAGILGAIAKVIDYHECDWRQVLDVNLTGVFLCMRRELALMAGHGSIVNISSVSATEASDYTICAYSVSKAGVDILTKVAAHENPNMFIAAVQATGMDTAINRVLSGTYYNDASSNQRLDRLGETVLRMTRGLPAYHGRVMHQHEWAQIVGVDL
jgi:NAD(P)-dependent dehydrogenase (short-subunit alcohol dehydrogenase family)